MPFDDEMDMRSLLGPSKEWEVELDTGDLEVELPAMEEAAPAGTMAASSATFQPQPPMFNSHWTADQDEWLKQKHLKKPSTKIRQDTKNYWEKCANEFREIWGKVRTAEALIKRLSILKITKRNVKWTQNEDNWLTQKSLEKPTTGIRQDTDKFWEKCAEELQENTGTVRTADSLIKRLTTLGLTNPRPRGGAAAERVTEAAAGAAAGAAAERVSRGAPVPKAAPPPPEEKWTRPQLRFIAECYYRKTKADWSAKNSIIYWNKCAKDFEAIFGKPVSRPVMKRKTSEMRMSKQTYEETLKAIEEPKEPKVKGEHHLWSSEVETWIEENVPPNTHVGNNFLRGLTDAFHLQFPHENERSFSAWRSKIKRVLELKNRQHAEFQKCLLVYP